MSDQSNAVEGLGGDTALKRLLIALCSISTLGMGCWVWLQHNRPLLPLPDSKAGRALLRQYQGLTHDIWLIFLLLAVGYLINRIYFSRQREAHKRSNYTPKVGDLIANLDKTISLIEPILKNLETDLIYQHNPSERTGVIRRITAIRQ